MTKRRILSMLLTMCMAFSMLSIPAMASGDVVWSQDTVLSGGHDYNNATIAPGVRVEIQTGILIKGTLSVGAGGKLVGKGLFYPEVGTSDVVGMTMYYRVAGAYKPFSNGLKTLWNANLWPGYAPHFEYDSAADLWYLYVEAGDFEADPFYTNTGAVNSSGGRNVNSAMNSASTLNMLGLFPATSTNPDGGADYDLTRQAPTYEAVVMLIRLLGKEKLQHQGTGLIHSQMFRYRQTNMSAMLTRTVWSQEVQRLLSAPPPHPRRCISRQFPPFRYRHGLRSRTGHKTQGWYPHPQ